MLLLPALWLMPLPALLVRGPAGLLLPALRPAEAPLLLLLPALRPVEALLPALLPAQTAKQLQALLPAQNQRQHQQT